MAEIPPSALLSRGSLPQTCVAHEPSAADLAVAQKPLQTSLTRLRAKKAADLEPAGRRRWAMAQKGLACLLHAPRREEYKRPKLLRWLSRYAATLPETGSIARECKWNNLLTVHDSLHLQLCERFPC